MGIFMNGNDWIKSATNYVRPSTTHTVMYWLRLDNSGSTRRPFGNTGAWEARTSGTTLTSDYLQSGTLATVSLTVGVFRHVAFVVDKDNNQRRPHLDGVQQNVVNTSSFAGQQTNVMSIGVTPGGSSQGWFGVVDDIRVYERALSTEEIQTIFACRGTDGIHDGLSVWYPLNEGAEGATVTACYEVTENAPDCVNVTGTPVYNYDAGLKRRRRV